MIWNLILVPPLSSYETSTHTAFLSPALFSVIEWWASSRTVGGIVR